MDSEVHDILDRFAEAAAAAGQFDSADTARAPAALTEIARELCNTFGVDVDVALKIHKYLTSRTAFLYRTSVLTPVVRALPAALATVCIEDPSLLPRARAIVYHLLLEDHNGVIFPTVPPTDVYRARLGRGVGLGCVDNSGDIDSCSVEHQLYELLRTRDSDALTFFDYTRRGVRFFSTPGPDTIDAGRMFMSALEDVLTKIADDDDVRERVLCRNVFRLMCAHARLLEHAPIVHPFFMAPHRRENVTALMNTWLAMSQMPLYYVSGAFLLHSYIERLFLQAASAIDAKMVRIPADNDAVCDILAPLAAKSNLQNIGAGTRLVRLLESMLITPGMTMQSVHQLVGNMDMDNQVYCLLAADESFANTFYTHERSCLWTKPLIPNPNHRLRDLETLQWFLGLTSAWWASHRDQYLLMRRIFHELVRPLMTSEEEGAAFVESWMKTSGTWLVPGFDDVLIEAMRLPHFITWWFRLWPRRRHRLDGEDERKRQIDDDAVEHEDEPHKKRLATERGAASSSFEDGDGNVGASPIPERRDNGMTMRRSQFCTKTRGQAEFMRMLSDWPLDTDRILILLENQQVNPRAGNDRLLRHAAENTDFRLIKALLSHRSYRNAEVDPRIPVSLIVYQQIVSMFGGAEMQLLLDMQQDLRTELLQVAPPPPPPPVEHDDRLSSLPYLMLVGVVSEHTALLTRLWGLQLELIFEIDPNSLLEYHVERGEVDVLATMITNPRVEVTTEAIDLAIRHNRGDIIQAMLGKLQGPGSSKLLADMMCLAVDEDATAELRIILAHDRVRDLEPELMQIFMRVACKSNDTQIVRIVLEFLRGTRMWSSADTFTGFFAHSTLRVVRMLVEEYAIDPAMDNDEFLVAAIRAGRVEIVRYLLHDPRVHPAVYHNYSLYTAIWARKLLPDNLRNGMEIIQMLLADTRVHPHDNPNVNPTYQRGHGLTPIEVAATTGQVDVVRLLLQDSRVDVTVSNNNPLFVACSGGHVEVVRELLANPRVDVRNTNDSVVQETIRRGFQNPRSAERVSNALQVLELLLADSRIGFSTYEAEACLRQICHRENGIGDAFLCALLRHGQINPIPDIEKHPDTPPDTWPIKQYCSWTAASLRAFWENEHVRKVHNSVRVAKTLAKLMCFPISLPTLPNPIPVSKRVHYYIQIYAEERRDFERTFDGTFENLLHILQPAPPHHRRRRQLGGAAGGGGDDDDEPPMKRTRPGMRASTREADLLLSAIADGNVSAVEDMLRDIRNIDLRHNGDAALRLAAERGDKEILKMLVAHKAYRDAYVEEPRPRVSVALYDELIAELGESDMDTIQYAMNALNLDAGMKAHSALAGVFSSVVKEQQGEQDMWLERVQRLLEPVDDDGGRRSNASGGQERKRQRR